MVPEVVAGLVSVIVGHGLITKVYVALFAKHPLASVAFTTIGNVPVTVGVPLNTPAEDKMIPFGNALTVLNVVVPMPPVCVNVWLNATFIWPVVTAGLVTDIAWQLITRLYDAPIPVQPLPSVTFTVTG